MDVRSDSLRTRERCRTISLADGLVTTVTDGANFLYGATWGDGNRIVFVRAGALWQVAASGGTPTQLTMLGGSNGDTLHAQPVFLPGGQTVLFGAASGERWRVESVSIATGERRTVIDRATMPLYAASGHLIFFRDGELLAAPFDPDESRGEGDCDTGDRKASDAVARPSVDRHLGVWHRRLCANDCGEPPRLGVARGRRAARERSAPKLLEPADCTGQESPARAGGRSLGPRHRAFHLHASDIERHRDQRVSDVAARRPPCDLPQSRMA